MSFGDLRVSSDKTDEFYIHLKFGPGKNRDWSELKVDRIGGDYRYEYKISSSFIAEEKEKWKDTPYFKDPIERVEGIGKC